eukprot:TRINITY_DN2024_c0_g3_i2.p2 TRINITY_DN2024_c0_g3~~TRINITY_DN2024_c0_g3_i2.p2  ORF type:complete len:100 (-),score=40.12 TRINITY_DN2024_c0_g3_i2:141-440(-)
MFLYFRTKGQIEETLKKLNYPVLSIFRPGAILNRDNDDRFGEKILKYVPFLDKIEGRDLARGIKQEAEKVHLQVKVDPTKNVVNLYENPQIVELARPRL